MDLTCGIPDTKRPETVIKLVLLVESKIHSKYEIYSVKRMRNL